MASAKLIRTPLRHPQATGGYVVFDQSAFVKDAIKTLLHEGLIGLLLTSLMILVFLGSFRATTAVFLSIPLSALATFVVLNMSGSTINTMILGGLALAFSRIIDNSVISLENIYRHLEMGASPAECCGGRRASKSVSRSWRPRLSPWWYFFPVTFLYGVSKFLFSRTGSGVRDFAVCFVLRRDDSHSAVLLPLSEGCATRMPAMAKILQGLTRRRTETILVGQVQRALQPRIQLDSWITTSTG